MYLQTSHKIKSIKKWVWEWVGSTLPASVQPPSPARQGGGKWTHGCCSTQAFHNVHTSQSLPCTHACAHNGTSQGSSLRELGFHLSDALPSAPKASFMCLW